MCDSKSIPRVKNGGYLFNLGVDICHNLIDYLALCKFLMISTQMFPSNSACLPVLNKIINQIFPCSSQNWNVKFLHQHSWCNPNLKSICIIGTTSWIIILMNIEQWPTPLENKKEKMSAPGSIIHSFNIGGPTHASV